MKIPSNLCETCMFFDTCEAPDEINIIHSQGRICPEYTYVCSCCRHDFISCADIPMHGCKRFKASKIKTKLVKLIRRFKR